MTESENASNQEPPISLLWTPAPLRPMSDSGPETFNPFSAPPAWLQALAEENPDFLTARYIVENPPSKVERFVDIHRVYDCRMDRIFILKWVHQQDNVHGVTYHPKGESLAIAQLNHPNVVKIYDAWLDKDNNECMILEHLAPDKYETLYRVDYYNREINPAEIANIISAVADVIDYANSLGILHRDINQKNILVSTTPTIISKENVKVIDFGMSNLAMTASRIGVLMFMSPEQMKGVDSDVRSDIWSLGVLAYHLSSGTFPFDGLPREMRDKIIKQDPDPLVLKSNFKMLDKENLSHIISKALEKDPENRYSTATEFAIALKGALAID